ncbi:hypothetical protein TWF225_002913 [Orbilia oligospora]|uniref:Uncharacterized protein n=1 Tax=Orbilia oligospora TaxID=2813651 RepID=A0A7C8JVX4_ORBOL|nr:hypothetical protein TWF751_003218 [Orbilia oligospora]KAF3161315.1 hypothetical protein TWF225_002913 [Orbilia oligospora]KAF3232741.1 hypothetical protein TWF128_003706 [Orbilia oligospora]KAF3235071.1 hypothetical protein TWF217_003369 [Orbilia oligospora]KAF3298392.1 hypothetical protein TWF132_000214 [Orbilia oligospora]
MGIPLWESPPDAKTLDKASATNRCDIHTSTHTSSGTSTRIPSAPGPSTSTGRGTGPLAYDYIYSGSRPIRRQILDSSDTIEIEDLQNEREHENQIRERERERDLSARMERSRRERGERRSAHMERFLNANYHTPPLPTTSTTSQRSRPQMIQPASDQLLTLSEFLRETSPPQPRNNSTAQNPSNELSALQQLLGLRAPTSNRGTGERRDIQAWERALSAAGIPPNLTPATTAVSTSNAAATISNPPPVPRRSASISTEWPPTSPARSSSPGARNQDSFQTLVNQIRRIGALQDYMLNSVDETAASLEESLSLHSQALNQALNTQSSAPTADTSTSAASPTILPDLNSQNYHTSLRIREARIRTMQSRIDLLASEFALLRSTRRELRRAENEAINMFQTAGVLPTSSTPAPVALSTATAAAVAALEIPTTTSPPPISSHPNPSDSIRTEVDEVDEALDAEGNSSRRVLRSTFLPADLGDEGLFRHFENAENRARVRERLAGVRRELEAEQARSTEIIQEQRRRMAEALAGTGVMINGEVERGGDDDGV